MRTTQEILRILDLEKFKEDYYSHRREELMSLYSDELLKDEVKLLIKELKLSRGKTYWYTDGVNDIKISEFQKTIPEGYHIGRTNGCDTLHTGGHIWVTNGQENKLVEPDKIPEGFHKGSTSSSTLGYTWYNNGQINKLFGQGAKVPKEFSPGAISTEKRKLAGQRRRKYYYNNGCEEISLFENETPPEGFSRGKLTLKIKKEYRDNLLDKRGYVPLTTLAEKYGTRSWFNHLENLDYIKFNQPFIYISKKEIPRIEDYIKNSSSFGENEVLEYLSSIYNGKIITHDRQVIKESIGKTRELDFYLPEIKLGLEFNGIYYHSDFYKDKNYHLEKTIACEKSDIRLIHIFEDLWITKNEIYKSIISSALNVYATRVYARDCEVKEVDKKLEKEFLDNNHLQGYVPSNRCIGLFHNGELVQLMSFSVNRFNSNEKEMLRMCSKLFTNVVGGFSKLVYHSGETEFISYIDRSIFTGKGYMSSGFSFIEYTKPSYYYFKIPNYLKRYNRMSFQKHKLKDKLEVFDPNLSEVENMRVNKYLRVFDCGNIKVKYKTTEV